jgi:hypothetical protein
MTAGALAAAALFAGAGWAQAPDGPRDGMDRMAHRGGRRGAPQGETQGRG